MKKNLLFMLIGAAIGLFIYLRGCSKDTPMPPSATLQTEDVAKVAVNSRHVAVLTDKGVKTTYVPEDGHASVTIKKTGDVVVRVTNKGLTLRPVAGLLVTDRLRASAGLQLGYWNRFEIYVGGAFPRPVAFAGIGYRTDKLKTFQNTSIYVAYVTDRYVGGGLLWRF